MATPDSNGSTHAWISESWAKGLGLTPGSCRNGCEERTPKGCLNIVPAGPVSGITTAYRSMWDLDAVIDSLDAGTPQVERICISPHSSGQILEDALHYIESLRSLTALPITITLQSSTLEPGDLALLRDAGATAVSLSPLADAERSPQRGLKRVNAAIAWNTQWDVLKEAVDAFGPGLLTCQLFAGLGETEHEAVAAIRDISAAGANTILYSFHPPEDPARGIIDDASEPCPRGQFRRLQLARAVIENSMASLHDMEFDEHGRITGFGLAGKELEELVDSGTPFEARACGSSGSSACECGIPFTDGWPAGSSGFSMKLGQEQVLTVRKQLATYREVGAPAEAAPVRGN